MEPLDRQLVRRADDSYLQRLAAAVALVNDCEAVIVSQDGHPYVEMVGHPEKLENAVSEYKAACVITGRAERLDWGSRVQNPLTTSKHRTAYWMGAVSAIEDNLERRSNDVAMAAAHHYDLLTTKSYRPVAVDARTYHEGYAFGQKLRLALGRASREAQMERDAG